MASFSKSKKQGRDTILLLMRHGEKEHKSHDEIALLTDMGKRGAYDFGRDLRSLYPDYRLRRMWSSHIGRTQQTARYLAMGFFGIWNNEMDSGMTIPLFIDEASTAIRIAENRTLYQTIPPFILDRLWAPEGYLDVSLPAALEPYNGMNLQEHLAIASIPFMEHAIRVHSRRNSDRGNLLVCVSHDFTIESLLYQIVTKESLRRIWDGKIEAKFLDAIEIRISGNDLYKNVRFFWKDREFHVQRDKIELLKAKRRDRDNDS